MPISPNYNQSFNLRLVSKLLSMAQQMRRQIVKTLHTPITCQIKSNKNPPRVINGWRRLRQNQNQAKPNHISITIYKLKDIPRTQTKMPSLSTRTLSRLCQIGAHTQMHTHTRGGVGRPGSLCDLLVEGRVRVRRRFGKLNALIATSKRFIVENRASKERSKKKNGQTKN